jgi:hypothetical protein
MGIDSTNVYWAEPTGIYKCAIGGCGGTPTLFVAGQDTFHLVSDGTKVYFSTPTQVMEADLAGLNGPRPIALNQNWPSNLVVDSARVYWTDFTSNVLSTPKP